jgi:hypothetical protein
MADNQSLGEIISRNEAEQQFGSVGISTSIESVRLQQLAGMTSDLMMFHIMDGKLVILGDKREVLYPEGASVPAETVFRVYSKTKVLELIEAGGAEDNSVEFRGETLTISNGDSCLEFGSLCPPVCG